MENKEQPKQPRVQPNFSLNIQKLNNKDPKHQQLLAELDELIVDYKESQSTQKTMNTQIPQKKYEFSKGTNTNIKKSTQTQPKMQHDIKTEGPIIDLENLKAFF